MIYTITTQTKPIILENNYIAIYGGVGANGDMKIWQWGASQVNGVIGDVDSNFGFFKLDGNGSGGTDPEDTPDEWAKEPQKWAVENGISDGTFPKRNVTRQEVWTMLYRYNNLIKNNGGIIK